MRWKHGGGEIFGSEVAATMMAVAATVTMVVVAATAMMVGEVTMAIRVVTSHNKEKGESKTSVDHDIDANFG